MPHDPPKAAIIDTARWLVRALVVPSTDPSQLVTPDGVPSTEGPLPDWLAALSHKAPGNWQIGLLPMRNLHLTMATGVLLSLLTAKTELIVREEHRAGKTQCIALLAAYFVLCFALS